ncbi:MAG TPA: Xaa-Pro peptidase family protein [Hypericibacter adhaerens]|jgi:Xaa-Pro aminopeptidase|uniref:Dipeptidase n=1 Tax=Hypericibacter adhaerens TaxID=2602016 RepID=A0A5J6N4G1_9PROT|nr:Xaa-Pro peptidase family protein [Hypericibacter adhaerens]QEX24317.1 dipeptidase [Hypericibacter adhaerens]HWA43019.1 Xaa-Pro peptidase family protein [Hypericibacter adhaerens]
MSNSYLRRISHLQQRLAEQRLDAALISDPDAIFYLSGFWGYSGLMAAGRPTLLWIPAGGPPQVITPILELEMAQRMSAVPDIRDWMDGVKGEWRGPLREAVAKDKARRIAIDAFKIPGVIAGFLQEEWPKVEKVDLNPILDAMRMIKDAEELQIMRDTGKVATAMAAAAEKAIGVGVPEYEVALAIIEGGTRKAAELLPADAPFDTPMIHNLQILQSGEDTCMVHRRSTVRRLKKGDPIYLCFCEIAKFKNYVLGFDREFFVGSVTDEQARLYEVALKAQAAALAAIRPGVIAEDVHAIADAVYQEAGFAPTYRTGRGVGTSILERPELKRGDKTALKPGMTFAVDGGLTVVGHYGARVGDSIVVTETGFDYLTPYPKSLKVIG